MNALEEDPEAQGRAGRMGMGALIAVVLGSGLIFGAKHIAPREFLERVVPFAVVDDTPPPPPKEEPPPEEEPEPEPEQPKEAPKPAAAPPVPQPAAPPSNQPPQDQVGLDADSFGSGSGGPAFNMGTSQMGVPGSAASGGPGEQELNPAPKVAPKLVEARARSTNKQPGYTDRARRLNVQGLMVVEAEIDENGVVKQATVRGRLEPGLDEEVRKIVLGWSFEPATLAGKAVASTKYLRFRFQLD